MVNLKLVDVILEAMSRCSGRGIANSGSSSALGIAVKARGTVRMQ